MLRLEELKLARYEIQLRARTHSELPPFLGSTLRGAFGHALKAVVCSVQHGDCSRCLLAEKCLYPCLFETAAGNGGSRVQDGSLQMSSLRSTLLKTHQDAPRPFIFAPPLPSNKSGFLRARDDFLRWRVKATPGDPFVFGLTLFGSAINELPYIVYAITLMAQRGFGAARAPFVLERVFGLDAQGKREVVYTAGSNRVIEHTHCYTTLARSVEVRLAQLAAAASQPGNMQSAAGDEVTLRFLTPTRLRVKGQVVESLSFLQLVNSISLRLSMLAETWGNAPLSYDHRSLIERAGEVSTRGSNLRLMALARYSNRRHGKLNLDGFMGDITFAGPAIRELLPLLIAGESLHVGSGTAFGLGRYAIVN